LGITGPCDYRPGQAVTVLYDPRDPAEMTIVGEKNQGPLASTLMWGNAVFGGLCLFLWLLMVIRRRRWRRLLARVAWRACSYRYAVLRGTNGSRALLALTFVGHPERDPLIVSVTGLDSRISALRPRSKDPLWVADDGRTILLATHTHGALYAAKRPTGIQQRARWKATIQRRAKPPTASPGRSNRR
jgi:hypothetical protein